MQPQKFRISAMITTGSLSSEKKWRYSYDQDGMGAVGLIFFPICVCRMGVGVCLCFCAVPALGESWIPTRSIYPDLRIWCTADPVDDLFYTASCGRGFFRGNDRCNDPGIYNRRGAGSVVSYQALGLFSCGLEFPGIYFRHFLGFLGRFGCGTGDMDPSVFFVHHTYMAPLDLCFRMPAAFDPGRSGFRFTDLERCCRDDMIHEMPCMNVAAASLTA